MRCPGTASPPQGPHQRRQHLQVTLCSCSTLLLLALALLFSLLRWHAEVSESAAPKPPSEYDELAKRLEALRRNE